jgi:hypothetical protein
MGAAIRIAVFILAAKIIKKDKKSKGKKVKK